MSSNQHAPLTVETAPLPQRTSDLDLTNFEAKVWLHAWSVGKAYLQRDLTWVAVNQH